MPFSVNLTVLLAAGAALVLIATGKTRPGPRGLIISLAAAAVLTGLYGAGSNQAAPAMAFALAAGAGAAAAAIDARHHLLPDAGAGLIALSGLAAALASGKVSDALIAGALSAAILIAAAMLTQRPGQGESLGEGDVLLAGACGLWLAPGEVSYALIGASALTAATGFATGAWRNSGGRIAFGPGLAAGYGLAAAGFAAFGGPS